MKLTDTIIAKTGPGPRELTDDQARGLKVRISRRGTKSFYLFYRIGTTRTLRTFLDQNYYPHAEQTQRSAGYAQRIFENDFQFLMRRELNAITWPDIDKWRTRELSRGIQPQTVNRKLCASKSALNRAVEWAMLESSPLNGRKRLKELNKGVVRWLSEEEKARLLSVLKNRIGKPATTIIYTLLYTGARPKEIFSLRWSAIDFENRTITLHAAFTKTATTRTIPMNKPLARVLRAWRSDSEWLFPGTGPTGHVVSIMKAWRIIKKEAGITNLRLYDLRHSFASELVQKKVPLYTVSKLLGHSSVQMTTIYAHLDNESLQEAVELL